MATHSRVQLNAMSVINTINGDTGEWHAAQAHDINGKPLITVKHRSMDDKYEWVICYDGIIKSEHQHIASNEPDDLIKFLLMWLVPLGDSRLTEL